MDKPTNGRTDKVLCDSLRNNEYPYFSDFDESITDGQTYYRDARTLLKIVPSASVIVGGDIDF